MPTAQDRAAGAMLGYPGRVFVVLLLAVLVWAQASPKEARCGLDRKDMPEQDRQGAKMSNVSRCFKMSVFRRQRRKCLRSLNSRFKHQ